MKFFKGSKYRDIYIALAKNLAVLAVLLVLLFFVSRDIEQRVDRIVSLKNNIAENLNLLEIYSSLSAEAKMVNPYIKLVERLLPTEDGLFLLKSDLIGEAKKIGIALNFDFGEREKIEDLSAIRINMSFQAPSLEKTILFFDSFKKMPFFLDVNQFTLENLNFSAAGRIFVAPLEPENN